MCPCGGSGDPSAGRAGEETLADEEGFGHLLDGLALLPHRDREGGQADRAAAEELEQGLQDSAVEAVEATGVDLVDLERCRGDVACDDSVGPDLGVVPDPAQQPVGDTGRAAERPAISAAPSEPISTSSRLAERWMTRSSSAGS